MVSLSLHHSQIFLIFSLLFISEDLLNILGDSWSVSSGRRRILYNAFDILLNVASLVYYFVPCYTERSCRIIGSMIVLLKFVRGIEVIVNEWNDRIACDLSKEYLIKNLPKAIQSKSESTR